VANPVFETSSPPYVNFRFAVVLTLNEPVAGVGDPVCSAAFAECNGLQLSMQPESFNEGGANAQQTHLKNPVSYGQLSLNRGMTPNRDLWAWMEAAGTAGVDARASGTITVFNPDGSTAVVFKLFDCLPTSVSGPSLNARNGDVAIEELQLSYGRLAVVDASGAGAGSSAGVSAGVSLSAGASLSVSGGPGLSASAGASAGINVR
jgi:phage tail-like protein